MSIIPTASPILIRMRQRCLSKQLNVVNMFFLLVSKYLWWCSCSWEHCDMCLSGRTYVAAQQGWWRSCGAGRCTWPGLETPRSFWSGKGRWWSWWNHINQTERWDNSVSSYLRHDESFMNFSVDCRNSVSSHAYLLFWPSVCEGQSIRCKLSQIDSGKEKTNDNNLSTLIKSCFIRWCILT